MSPFLSTQSPPDAGEVADWLRRLRRDHGLAAAQEAVFKLVNQFPNHEELQALAVWHRFEWWQPLDFGAVRLERRSTKHFDFVWATLLDREFSRRLKQVPKGFTPRNLLRYLARDEAALIPEQRARRCPELC